MRALVPLLFALLALGVAGLAAWLGARAWRNRRR